MRRLGLVLAILTGGCSTTAFDFAQSHSTERWLRERASYEERVVETTGPQPRSERDTTLVESTSPTQLRFRTSDERIIPLEQVQQIVVIKRARGAAEGALFGAAIGVAAGVTVGYSQDLSPYEASMDCTIVCSRGDAAKLKGAMFGALGLLLGTLVGALIGHRDILILK